MLKILFNAVDAEATGYQRILSPVYELAAQDLAQFQPINTDDVRKQLRWANLVVLQCLADGPNLNLVKKCKEKNIPVIIDYDDNFSALPSSILHRLNLTQQQTTDNWQQYLLLADVVTCTSDYLAQIIKNLIINGGGNPNKVHVLPNYLTTSEYYDATNYQPKWNTNEVRILYSCSDSHLPDFKWIAPVLMNLGKIYPQVRIISQGNLDWGYLYPEYTGKISKALSAPYLSYHQSLREINPHICIAPLLSNEYAKCRSDIKYLQTASVKAVFVGSNLPPYQETVLHGQTGFLTNNRLGWWWYLRKLILQPDLCQSMGQAAYQHAKKFILKDHIHKWFSLYDSLIRQPASGSSIT